MEPTTDHTIEVLLSGEEALNACLARIAEAKERQIAALTRRDREAFRREFDGLTETVAEGKRLSECLPSVRARWEAAEPPAAARRRLVELLGERSEHFLKIAGLDAEITRWLEISRLALLEKGAAMS